MKKKHIVDQSEYRGRDMFYKDNQWLYLDNNEPTVNNRRFCGHCKKDDTKEGHDNCLGILPDVMNACCGHGIEDEAYIQFWNNRRIGGKEAIEWIKTYEKETKR